MINRLVVVCVTSFMITLMCQQLLSLAGYSSFIIVTILLVFHYLLSYLLHVFLSVSSDLFYHLLCFTVTQ